MWRWREGAPLRAAGGSNGSSAAAAGSPHAAQAGPSYADVFSGSPAEAGDDCWPLAHMGVVAYGGAVLALGGRHYWNGSEWASKKVHGYDPVLDCWSELLELPFPVCHASPVTMRLPNLL